MFVTDTPDLWVIQHPDFLKNEASYKACEAIWKDVWNEVGKEVDVSKWKTPWLNVYGEDEFPFGDGQSIFSAFNEQESRGINLTQFANDEKLNWLNCWTEIIFKNAPEETNTLKIATKMCEYSKRNIVGIMVDWIKGIDPPTTSIGRRHTYRCVPISMETMNAVHQAFSGLLRKS